LFAFLSSINILTSSSFQLVMTNFKEKFNLERVRVSQKKSMNENRKS
jgi:hypothetical protein